MAEKKFLKYSFHPYSKDYPKLFAKEKARIKKFLPKANIEHIGSTAVPGLGGKGIVDVVVDVPLNDWNTAKSLLEKEGYEFRPNGGCPKRMFFQRIIKSKGAERRVHVHLTFDKNSEFIGAIAARDYLRARKEARDEYTQLKKKAVAYADGDGKRYRQYKNNFLSKLNKKALKYFIPQN